MKKNKGFTLLELLVSMALLSFVIMLSAVLFDRAIQGTPELKSAIKNQSENMTNIEKSILMVKDVYRHYKTPEPRKKEDEPKDFKAIKGDNSKEGEPISLDLGNPIVILNSSGAQVATTSTAKGYLISVPKTNAKQIKYNDASAGDALVTFVSVGHELSDTSTIEKLYINESNGFKYFSKNHNDLDLTFYYSIANKNRTSLDRMRLRFLKSPHSNNSGIYSVYNEGYVKNPSNTTLTQDLFDYDGDEKDSKNLSDTVSYKINSFSVDRKNYLNSIDKNYAATAVTFNLNGRVGPAKTTFDNNDDNKQNSIYLIGLPIIDNLVAHYDTNLVLSKSSTEANKYLSLFDLENKDKTAYPNNLSVVDNDNYSFDWAGSDIRNFLALSSDTPQIISMPKAFLRKVEIANIEEGSTITSNYRKPYGDTLYYNMDEISNSIKLNSPNDYTFFVKYNPLNYNQEFNSLNSSETHTYSILSHNIDLKTGLQLDPTKPGFTLYVDKDGTLVLYSFVKRGTQMVSEYRNLGYNMNNSGLYTNSNNYKFDGLAYDGKINDKRDGRKDFNITCIAKDSTGFDVFILGRDMNAKDLKTTTHIAKIAIDGIDYSGDFYFGSNVERLVDLKSGNSTEFFDSSKLPVIEISDIIVYKNKFLWNNSSNNISTTMNYLYRKYLTDNERGEIGKFDENILSNY